MTKPDLSFSAHPTSIRQIIFDLDDTLMDTHGRLVLQAAREACVAMISAGLNTDVESCLRERVRFISAEPRGNVYAHLAATFGVSVGGNSGFRDSALGPRNIREQQGHHGRHGQHEHHDPGLADHVAMAGFRAFHEREVEHDIDLFEGVGAMLDRLAKQYPLCLVTAGNERTQRRKVELLGIASRFRDIFYTDPARGQSKGEVFRRIMLLSPQVAPDEFLSVGNRVDADLSPAKALGWRTCLVKVGEYAHLDPVSRDETPDHVINNIMDLCHACRL